MSRIRDIFLKYVYPDAFKEVNVQYPMPTDGDRIYAKDIDIVSSDNGGFSGVVTDYFDNLKTVSNDASVTNPKIIKIWFKGSQQTSSVGFGCDDDTKSFSNIVVKLFGSDEVIRSVADQSADSTKYNSLTIDITPEKANGVIIEFHTADEVGLSNLVIFKSVNVNARIQALKDSGAIGDMKLSASNRLETVSQPYGYAISAGELVGKSYVSSIGERTAITTSPSDVNPLTATVTPIPPDAGSLISIVSTSTEDTLTTGIGAWTVHIHYIDPAGNEQLLTANLTGTTVVNTGILMRYINGFHVYTAGSTGAAVGNITAYLTGTPATVYRRITPNTNGGLTCSYMVPAGHTFFITSWKPSSAGAGKPVAIRLRGTFGKRNGVITPRLFQVIDSVYLETSAIAVPFTMPIKAPALSIIKATAYASQAGPYVSASFEGWLTEGVI